MTTRQSYIALHWLWVGKARTGRTLRKSRVVYAGETGILRPAIPADRSQPARIRADLRVATASSASKHNGVRTHVSLGKDAPCSRPIERFWPSDLGFHRRPHSQSVRNIRCTNSGYVGKVCVVRSTVPGARAERPPPKVGKAGLAVIPRLPGLYGSCRRAWREILELIASSTSAIGRASEDRTVSRQRPPVEMVRRRPSPLPRSVRAVHNRAPTLSRCSPCRSRRWPASCAACR